ncbi:cysteine/Histidine-rich C1 domain family protein [Striga asiatica]|uniref:Cysteine/Histidine-rich C1 domain family protein n=1 Tax=Striga asiatica TaxID=4170 RepID=A0A5A7Q1A4_STRAF|nr:cysteine/Histidine-rich C1 domain family protein [Striga asiatica]
MYQELFKIGHTIPYPEVQNTVDLDDANFWTCAACRLPIFSTPFVEDKLGGSNLLLHDQCSDKSLPPQLPGHPLHPRDPSSSDTIAAARKKMTMQDMIANDVCRFAGANFTSVRWLMIETVGSGSISRAPCPSRSYIGATSTVLVSEAEFTDLLRLPMENEHASAMPHIMKTKAHAYPSFCLGSTTTSHDHPISSMTSNSSSLTQLSSMSESFSLETIRVHEHPLIYHDRNDIVRVCNACTQIILPPDPFYSCAHNNNNNNNNNNTCKDFSLHSCCYSFPKTFGSYHTGYCSFRPKVATKPFAIFECVVCKHKCNGSAYYIQGGEEKYMDVVCALMPHLIMHGAHGKAHILQGRWEVGEFYQHLVRSTCKCCHEKFNEDTITSYTCSNCRSFSIHPHCAFLPETVTHKFDRHPLKLITSSSRGEEEENRLCENCEKDMDLGKWHYGCEECEQYFHANCIPCLDRLSKIKFGFEVSVGFHECPVACVRAVSVDGYPCGHCGKSIRESDDIAFECSKCYFRMHQGCVQELMIKT